MVKTYGTDYQRTRYERYAIKFIENVAIRYVKPLYILHSIAVNVLKAIKNGTMWNCYTCFLVCKWHPLYVCLSWPCHAMWILTKAICRKMLNILSKTILHIKVNVCLIFFFLPKNFLCCNTLQCYENICSIKITEKLSNVHQTHMRTHTQANKHPHTQTGLRIWGYQSLAHYIDWWRSSLFKWSCLLRFSSPAAGL